MNNKLQEDSIQKVSVVIPVYKDELNKFEIISLKRCVEIFSNHTITIICSEGLDLNEYFKIYPGFRIEYFDKIFFESIYGYNRLMLDYGFYKRFAGFKYILIYQLDAYVFRDELEYWCDKNFDYIGAPWFEGFDNPKSDARFIGIGNGGFSLRKVKSHRRVLQFYFPFYAFKSLHEAYYQYKLSKLRPLKRLILFLKSFCARLSMFKKDQSLRQINMNEDGFWAVVVPRMCFWFKLADQDSALKFSFETNADRLYQMNGKQLPFGCHGWAKYNIDFWKEFIR